MTTDPATEASFDFGNVLDVVDMSVRQEQEFKIDIVQLDPLAGAVGRVEQNPSLGRFQQITVRLEKATAESFVSHGRGPGCGDISIELCLCILPKAGIANYVEQAKFSTFLNVTTRPLSQFLMSILPCRRFAFQLNSATLANLFSR